MEIDLKKWLQKLKTDKEKIDITISHIERLLEHPELKTQYNKSIYKKEYRLKNKDKIKIYNKEHRLENRDKILKQQAEYRLKNKDKLKAYRLKRKNQQNQKEEQKC